MNDTPIVPPGAPSPADLRRLILPATALDEAASVSLGKRARARMKACWLNAARALAYAPPGTRYVEGFLLSPLGDKGPLLPHEHAFLLTADGRVIDPTVAANPDLTRTGGYTVGEVYASAPASALERGEPSYGMRYTPRMLAAQEAAHLVAFGQPGEDDAVTVARMRGVLRHSLPLYAREPWTDPLAEEV